MREVAGEFLTGERRHVVAHDDALRERLVHGIVRRRRNSVCASSSRHLDRDGALAGSHERTPDADPHAAERL
jgi:hypothetical protein